MEIEKYDEIFCDRAALIIKKAHEDNHFVIEKNENWYYKNWDDYEKLVSELMSIGIIREGNGKTYLTKKGIALHHHPEKVKQFLNGKRKRNISKEQWKKIGQIILYIAGIATIVQLFFIFKK